MVTDANLPLTGSSRKKNPASAADRVSQGEETDTRHPCPATMRILSRSYPAADLLPLRENSLIQVNPFKTSVRNLCAFPRLLVQLRPEP